MSYNKDFSSFSKENQKIFNNYHRHSFDTMKLGKEGECTICIRKDVTPDEFINDSLAWKEYHISGICKPCQDKIFGG